MRLFKAEWIRLILVFIVLFFLYGFAQSRSRVAPVKEQKIVFNDKEELYFLNQQMVNKLLIQNNFVAEKVTKDRVDLKDIEDFLDSHENIDKAQVFMTIDGVFNVEIVQKKPLVRVVNEDFSYYIDTKGGFIPLSDNYTARVPLLMGNIEDEQLEGYMPFFDLLESDDFFRKNIIGVKVLSNGELVLKNRSFDYDILFGKPHNIEEKKMKYKAFFNKAVKDSTINKYKSINLKYARQVVCAQ